MIDNEGVVGLITTPFCFMEIVKKKICNCSEPSIFLQLNVMNACIRERLAVKIYLADTPHRENNSFRGWL